MNKMLVGMLVPMCVFAVVAGTWLGVMENILKHEGYAGRTVIAACIALQGFATLLFIRLRGSSIFRGLLMAGAIAIIWLGYRSVGRVLHSPHFEGYVLVIGAALILQGVLTLATAARQYYPERP